MRLFLRWFYMEAIAQLAERQIVALNVTGSNPVSLPNKRYVPVPEWFMARSAKSMIRWFKSNPGLKYTINEMTSHL